MKEVTPSEDMQHFLCAVCVTSYPSPGFCPMHPDEPLLDVRQEQTLDFLSELDMAGLRKKLFRLTVGLTAPFLVFGYLCFHFFMNTSAELGEVAGSALDVSMMIALFFWAFLLRTLRNKAMRSHLPRFGQWTDPSSVFCDIDRHNSTGTVCLPGAVSRQSSAYPVRSAMADTTTVQHGEEDLRLSKSSQRYSWFGVALSLLAVIGFIFLQKVVVFVSSVSTGIGWYLGWMTLSALGVGLTHKGFRLAAAGQWSGAPVAQQMAFFLAWCCPSLSILASYAIHP